MSWWTPPAWPAPAKLNLMLRIIGRRADGYHLLQTVFQFIDFGDSIEFELNDEGRIGLRRLLPGVSEDADLTVRAARSLQQKAGCCFGARIKIDKRIPVGGGLGGGSSDAATTLVALNHLWGTGLTTDELATLGLSLGADVPVFVRGQAAWAEGVGEDLTPLELPRPWFLVVRPPVSVDTGAVFKHPELTRNSTPITIADFFSGALGNDCLSVVEKSYPEIAGSLAALAEFGKPRLTGTGSCVFVEFSDKQTAREALGELSEDADAFVAKGCNRSPLLDAWAEVARQPA